MGTESRTWWRCWRCPGRGRWPGRWRCPPWHPPTPPSRWVAPRRRAARSRLSPSPLWMSCRWTVPRSRSWSRCSGWSPRFSGKSCSLFRNPEAARDAGRGERNRFTSSHVEALTDGSMFATRRRKVDWSNSDHCFLLLLDRDEEVTPHHTNQPAALMPLKPLCLLKK